jgi:hypothetical protein
MRPASALATECISEASTLLVSASANFHERSANSVNRSPIEAGNNQMLCPSIGACNRNNFCESFTMRAATQTCFGDGVRSSGHRFAARRRSNDSSRCYSCRCYSCRVRNAGIITYEGAAKPAAGQRNLTGAVRSHGRDGTRTRGNEGAIANVGFVIGADAVASSRMFRMARNVSALRPRTRRAACSRTNRRSTVRGFDGVRHRPN